MPYVTKDLEDEDEKQQGAAPTLGATAPKSGPSMTAGVGGSQAQPQRNQAQQGTGYVHLQQWLDAGKGRDKAVSEKGKTALTNEQTKLGEASTKAEDGLASQNVLAPTGSVADTLNREAGITPPGVTTGTNTAQPVTQPVAPNVQPVPRVGPAPLMTGGPTSVLAPGSVTRIGTAPPTQPQQPSQPARSAPTIAEVPTGPSLADVIGQTYTGPTTIDYKPGQDLMDLAALSNTGSIADVTGRAANEAGEYSKYSGMRALDDALYGADAASIGAAGANKESGQKFAKDTDEKVTDFEKRAGERAQRMTDQATSVRNELQGIFDAETGRLKSAAATENERAIGDSHRTDMVRDPNTGQLVQVPQGQVLGDWEGSEAGSATIGNMMTGTDAKRFGALAKLLGIEAPEQSGTYAAGRRTTKAGAPADVRVTSPEAAQTFDALLSTPGRTGPMDAVMATPQGQAYRDQFIRKYGPEEWYRLLNAAKRDGRWK